VRIITSETYGIYERCAEELALMPDVIARLIVGHGPDGDGWCMGCRRAGSGYPAVEHPCPLHQLAMMALDVRRRRRQAVAQDIDRILAAHGS
jgi:hypothetical protein